MASFDLAIPVILQHEGEAFTNGMVTPTVGKVPPGDPPTKWGITLTTLRRINPDATARDVKELSRQQASDIYRELWWDAYGYEKITAQLPATKIFDASVNVGPHQAHRFAQMAATSIGHLCDLDGMIGPSTITAVNACEPDRFVREFGTLMATHYLAWIARDPARDKDLSGLMARAGWPFLQPKGAKA